MERKPWVVLTVTIHPRGPGAAGRWTKRRAMVFESDEAAREYLRRVAESGEYFDEIEIFDGDPRSADGEVDQWDVAADAVFWAADAK